MSQTDLQIFQAFASSYQHQGEPYFRSDAPINFARAPGRLDIMGGIADYSGSLVLEMPIAEATLAAAQLDEKLEIRVLTLSEGRPTGIAEFVMPLDRLSENDQPISYEAAQAFFRHEHTSAWAAYVLGAFFILRCEKGARFPHGIRILLQSSVPEGKGVSSSAAVEVAGMIAISDAYGIKLSADEVASLCQMVENHIAGAPCGIMDQMTVVHGRPNQLLALLCQPSTIQGYVAIPEEYTFWGIDSGIRHAVSGADYGSVRVGAFMGCKILQRLGGQDFNGYLANITPALFEQHYRALLPVSIRGAEFLAQFGSLPDAVTTVEVTQTYAVRQPTAHPIYEHFRVQAFAHLLNGSAPENGPLLGELMYQAHASYSACGLGSDGTDLLVDLVRAEGIENGLFGAKITGGGSGGTVVVLGRADARPALERVVTRYENLSSHRPYVFTGSSAGALG